ncbi:hypothetical protein [Sphingobacterium sp. SGR-19]|uniref:HD domain-containing protein n=1 Tax=Sphingobacterium sp. SGR-19 TaxID=2710886 RepID=UPI0013EC1D21|nr:hypothetical protein [Sphingobacterium sp. SGR-19]NGM67035.1 hypothetical protein [Sphingobacterium sp. SGR-19]
MQLKQKFHGIASKYTNNDQLIEGCWKALEECYTAKGRFYHNAHHLEEMILVLDPVKHEIQDRDSLLLSVFYHDIIYNPTAVDNEEKSADSAQKQLKRLCVPAEKIHLISEQIMATKTHEKSDDTDTNFLLDADLCVLGKSWRKYLIYSNQIRKEYAIYPDAVYKQGRKKVLTHLLHLKEIFKTDFFQDKYEHQARENIRKEIERL